jgi:serine/threonine protein kinase
MASAARSLPGLQQKLEGAVLQGSAGVSYYLRQRIGEGGQGWVFKANYDAPEGFWVVVKVLRSATTPEAIARFEREANVLRKLGAAPAPNLNVVRFLDFGLHPVQTERDTLDVPFIVLEYVPGLTLAEVLAKAGKALDVGRARRVLRQVARALMFVHGEGLVHRDLKPSNVLLTELQGQELAKITDFGIVKSVELQPFRTEGSAGATLGYAPPEQYEPGNKRVGPVSDVFSFAAVAYECLSGQPAFPMREGDSALSVVSRMIQGARPSLRKSPAAPPWELTSNPEALERLDEVLARALAADPADRTPTVREVWSEIEPLLRDKTIPSMPVSPALGLADDPSHAPLAPIESKRVLPSPAAWHATGRGIPGERLRCAVVVAPRVLVALGAYGLYRFAAGVWSIVQLPAGVSAANLRGLVRLASGELLLFGEAGTAVRLSPAGVSVRVDLPDRVTVVLAAHEDPYGLWLAGDRAGAGFVLRAGAPEPEVVPNAGPLHGLSRATSGELVAVGDGGTVAVQAGDGAWSMVPWARSGHLLALAPLANGELVAVGTGGHALRLKRDGAGLWGVTIEAVQATRDLVAVAVDPLGYAWAGAAAARLLVRPPPSASEPGGWLRLLLPDGIVSTLVGVWPGRDGVVLLTEDGLVLEAPLV